MPDPLAELHPNTAAARDVAQGDWITIETPHGQFRARVRLRAGIDPRVVVAQHGWWQGCPELELPCYDPVGDNSANYNTAIRADDVDPVSGVPKPSVLCVRCAEVVEHGALELSPSLILRRRRTAVIARNAVTGEQFYQATGRPGGGWIGD